MVKYAFYYDIPPFLDQSPRGNNCHGWSWVTYHETAPGVEPFWLHFFSQCSFKTVHPIVVYTVVWKYRPNYIKDLNYWFKYPIIDLWSELRSLRYHGMYTSHIQSVTCNCLPADSWPDWNPLFCMPLLVESWFQPDPESFGKQYHNYLNTVGIQQKDILF